MFTKKTIVLREFRGALGYEWGKKVNAKGEGAGACATLSTPIGQTERSLKSGPCVGFGAPSQKGTKTP